ncbi:MAG: hypothetical protein EOP84_22020 [Verrucomicrobiaceae bacterium]|nr:MAG: hypothetical protein EOP84_22020 [Verrucomicrobiaceae bacterium]
MPEVTEIDGSPEDNIRAVLSTKNYRWAYEREWRLFTALPGRTAYQTQNALTSLYIGSRIDQETEGKLRQAADNLAIPVRKLKIRGYGLEFDAPLQR